LLQDQLNNFQLFGENIPPPSQSIRENTISNNATEKGEYPKIMKKKKIVSPLELPHIRTKTFTKES